MMLLALLAALATGAQSAPEAADLTQITIRIPAEASESVKAERQRAFAAAARSITSCGQIEAVARQADGEIVSREKTLLTELPEQLRVQLAGKPAGTVTQVFGQDGEYRMVIRC